MSFPAGNALCSSSAPFMEVSPGANRGLGQMCCQLGSAPRRARLVIDCRKTCEQFGRVGLDNCGDIIQRLPAPSLVCSSPLGRMTPGHRPAKSQLTLAVWALALMLTIAFLGPTYVAGIGVSRQRDMSGPFGLRGEIHFAFLLVFEWPCGRWVFSADPHPQASDRVSNKPVLDLCLCGFFSLK